MICKNHLDFVEEAFLIWFWVLIFNSDFVFQTEKMEAVFQAEMWALKVLIFKEADLSEMSLRKKSPIHGLYYSCQMPWYKSIMQESTIAVSSSQVACDIQRWSHADCLLKTGDGNWY